MEFTTLMHIEFGRTSFSADAPPTHVTYYMKRHTPFGVLEAREAIEFLHFKYKGVEACDFEMMQVLGDALQREEQGRLLETAANTNFGQLEVA